MNDEEALVQDFILESEEHLESVEEKAVKLEEEGEDSELVNSLFRSFHTIKGNAKWLGFAPIADVTHSIESLLGDLRNSRIHLSNSTIDVILQVKDIISDQIEKIKAGEELDTKTQQIISQIEEERQKSKTE